MKKFLKKLPVMITLVALSVVLLGVYIYMLARPVSYGMAYKHTEKTDENNYMEQTVVVQNNKKAKVTTIGKELGVEITSSMTCWIVTNGNKFAVVGIAESENIPSSYLMTEEQYNELVKALPENFWESEDVTKSTAFSFEIDDETFTCTGAIVFAAVGGVVELCLLTFATLSVIFFIQDKKKKA